MFVFVKLPRKEAIIVGRHTLCNGAIVHVSRNQVAAAKPYPKFDVRLLLLSGC